MTYLVTGATGLLGSHLIDLLVERGERPSALVRPGETADQLAATCDTYVADLIDAPAVRAALTGVDCVLHCAARTGPWGPSNEYEDANVRGVGTVIREARAAGVGRVVHVSSITVHGNDVGGDADEGAPLRGAPNPYSRSKVAGELLVKRLIEEEGAPVTVVRPGWIYGPRDVASFGRFARMILSGRMVMVGSGDNHLPLIYVRDVARGMLRVAATPAAEGRTYLLVNDEPITQRRFLAAIAQELGVPPPSRRVPYRMALALGTAVEVATRLAGRPTAPPVMRYGVQLLGGENRFSIERATTELGFRPEIGCSEGVRRSVAWYRDAHSAAWEAAGLASGS